MHALLTSLLLSAFLPLGAGADSDASATVRSPTTFRESSAPDVFGLPKIRMPRFRMPGRFKKNPADAPLALIDRRLRQFVGQQESWFVGHQRYSVDVPNVTRSRPGTLSPADSALENVQVQVIYAHARGWTAVASHPGAPGKSCVVFVGFRETLPFIPRTRADAAEAVDEGRPVCDK
ncbi:MAG TPA: hypothetical protein VE869_10655 [Gemmatimonas sp.]|nr:hypothetical protein [Gemmatimonas sp.]